MEKNPERCNLLPEAAVLQKSSRLSDFPNDRTATTTHPAGFCSSDFRIALLQCTVPLRLSRTDLEHGPWREPPS
jgi:hypothetical protein